MTVDVGHNFIRGAEPQTVASRCRLIDVKTERFPDLANFTEVQNETMTPGPHIDPIDKSALTSQLLAAPHRPHKPLTVAGLV